MKTIILIITLVLIFGFRAKATVDCIWASSMSGVTIRYIAACDFDNQVILDSFLKKTLRLLNRQDTTLKVLILVNNGRLSFSGATFSNFISVAYDTLREIDDDFIFNHYWTKGSGGPGDTKIDPIDINSTDTRSTFEIGVKIIYDKDYRNGQPDWGEVSKLIVYAVTNTDKLKQLQTRDTVRYNSNGWFVSLVTLDTFQIRGILKRSSSNATQLQARPKTSSNKRYLIIAGISAALILGLIVFRRKYGS